jgi:FkbM family methyltransferase
MPASINLGRRIGNQLYKAAFPIYRPLYSAFKAYADREERQLLRRHLSEGCVVADVGANIGVYSKFFAQCVGPTGRVHSFEPSLENFARLRQTIATFSNVRVNQLAVSDTTGESLLYVSEELNVDHRSYPTEGEARKAVSIRSTRLDDYFRSGERVDLIKMDIQGYELHALRGAERVLSENARVKLLIEFWPYGLRQAGASAEALITFVRDQGFSLFLPQGNQMTRCDHPVADASDPAIYLNLFAQKADH